MDGELIPAEFAPGSVVGGKYRVDDVIGDGGLGVVLKAWHQQLDQPVAIKVVKPDAVSRPGVVERFLREARLAARIKNEHAVKVFDVDEAESGVPYMVMEYLEGRDLEQIVTEAPLHVHVAIDYLLQAIEAVAEAHAAGIVHRDLKPANLFLARRPGSTSIVKVLDFGISKVTSADAQQRKRLTRHDERVGTPAFMSPEQLQAAPDVDARADVWALGVVLYELVTGRLPFDGLDHLQQVVDGHVDVQRRLGHDLLEVTPLEVLHDHVGHAALGCVDVVDLHGVLVLDSRGEARLAQEALDDAGA